MVLAKGGAGFKGTNFIPDWIATEGSPVINVDKLPYAGNLRAQCLQIGLGSLGVRLSPYLWLADIDDQRLE